jgi:formylglycine-generating enzyme
MRLREGPLLLVSFTGERERRDGHGVRGSPGRKFRGVGMFAALSFDEGQTWPVRKLLTPGQGEYDGGAWTGAFTASPTRAEHGGYLAATQTPDGVIHLISSRLHYRFNLAWLKEPNEPAE